MSTSPEPRRSQRKGNPAQRDAASNGIPEPSTSQRPLPLKRAAARKKAFEKGSVTDDVRAASIPLSYYEDLDASYPDEFYAGDDGPVPYHKATMEELEDPEKLIKYAVALAEEADTAFTKIKMSPEWVEKLRQTNGYPYFYPLTLNAVREKREKIRVFDKNGPPGAYIRETEFYDTYLPREFVFPEEINKVPKKIRPKKICGHIFDPKLKSWLDCEKNFWDDIPQTFNNNVLYAPEVDGNLFEKAFGPFNLHGMIGFLKDAFRSQGNIAGIFTNVVYFGRARSSFPWHCEDFELLSANYHHLGAPKVWFGLPPSQKKLTYETFRNLYRFYYNKCPQEHRHKRLFTLPAELEKARIRVTKTEDETEIS